MSGERRYQVGFTNGAKCVWADNNPGFVPIVDMGTPFAFGVCIALADHMAIAEEIVDALNARTHHHIHNSTEK